jgi:hypothetical protein
MSPGAEFELSIDVKQCSYRLREGIGSAVAELVKVSFPNCDVVVNHLPSGEVTVVAYKPGSRPH